MRDNWDNEPPQDLADMLEPLEPSPQWQQMGIQIGFWPFDWMLEVERVYPLPWHIYSVHIGPVQFTVNVGRWGHAD